MSGAPVLGLGGGVLLAVICVLLLAEEAGVPLPFLPGDLLLAAGGVAVASGRLNPFVFIPAAYAALAAGAVVAWALFSRLDWERLLGFARRVHAAGLLERAAHLLRHAGWRAVFVSRLIPGLRIYTTQVAAVSHMARRPFFTGLLAANAVYVAIFAGLGGAAGRPVVALIERGESGAAAAVAGLVLVTAVVVLRTRAHRVMAWLELDDWRGAFLRRPGVAGVALVPVAVGIDFSGHAVAQAAHLPLFLDSVGTVLVAMLAGPWAGGVAGLVANLVSAGTIDPIAAPYSVVSLGLGLAAGLAVRRDWTRWVRGLAVMWGVCFWVAALLSTPLDLVTNGGRSGVGMGDAVLAALTAHHVPSAVAAFAGEAVVDLPDKLVTILIAALIAQAVSGRYLSWRAAPRPASPRRVPAQSQGP